MRMHKAANNLINRAKERLGLPWGLPRSISSERAKNYNLVS